jgi:hypothetical protein
MQTAERTDVTATLEAAIADAEKARDYLLNTFSFVPDEKLFYSPAKGARSAQQLVVHCGMVNGFFASIIRNEVLESPADMDTYRDFLMAEESKVVDRQTAIEMVRECTDDAIAAIRAVTPESFASSPNSPFGPMPMPFWIRLPGIHMKAHASQLDYLQTMWGDFRDHF